MVFFGRSLGSFFIICDFVRLYRYRLCEGLIESIFFLIDDIF